MAIVKPAHINEDVWSSHSELGTTVAALVLDALAVYASGDFAGWEGERVRSIESSLAEATGREKIERNLVAQHILVERLKEKEFFCCSLCQASLFNHKHALIHFTSSEHIAEESDAVRDAGVDGVRRVLDEITKLPQRLAKDDEMQERKRQIKNGPFYATMIHELRPEEEFLDSLCEIVSTKFVNRRDEETGAWLSGTFLAATTDAVKVVNGKVGKTAFGTLKMHLAEQPTFCMHCHVHTGDQEDFFAHFVSYQHMRRMKEKNLARFDVLTALINMQRRDLI